MTDEAGRAYPAIAILLALVSGPARLGGRVTVDTGGILFLPTMLMLVFRRGGLPR